MNNMLIKNGLLVNEIGKAYYKLGLRVNETVKTYCKNGETT